MNIISKPIDPLGMIKDIIKLKLKEEYDQFWCVFDIDSTTKNNIDKAFKLASKNKIKIAYSNESFELWYILHFEYLNSAISRKQYLKKLSKYFNRQYKKNDIGIYEKLLGMQGNAIKNSKKLLKNYKRADPFNNNPSTTVHKIILELTTNNK